MGRTALHNMLIHGQASGLDQRAILAWHLRYNHVPAQSLQLMAAASLAIDAMLAGDDGRKIQLPEGASHHLFGRAVPAFALVEALHLWEFIALEERDVTE